MNKSTYFLVLFVIFVLQSCKHKQKVNYSLTVFTQKLNSNNSTVYPDEFKKLLLPIQADIDKNTTVVFNCISKEHTVTIQRIDGVYKMPLAINTDSKLGKVMSGNKGAENRLNKAFDNLELPQELQIENTIPDFNKLSSFDKNIYILSNKYEQDSISILGNSYRVFNQIEELKNSLLQDLTIKQKVGKNIGEYAVLYNVDLSSLSGTPKPPADSTLQQQNNTTTKITLPSLTKPEINNDDNKGKIASPKVTPQTASSLEDLLFKLTSTQYDDRSKESLASSGYLNYFTSNATVLIVDNNGVTVDTYPIKEYIGHIRNRNIKIRTVSRVPQDGKCSKLTVKEP